MDARDDTPRDARSPTRDPAEMIVSVQAGDLLLQAIAGLRDTVVLKQVAPNHGIIAQLADIATLLIALALLVLLVVAIPVVWRLRRAYTTIRQVVARFERSTAPIVRHVTAIADNVDYVTTSIRADVAKVNATIAGANERVREAVETAERRLNEFNALLAVVQDEAEHLFVATAATARGVRRGASAFARNDGMDLASDELEEPEPSDELETMEDREEFDGNDSYTGKSEPRAAPRVRPRPRGF